MNSKDIVDEIAAENAIKAIEDPKELQMFIKGEQREGLLDVAAFRLNVLKNQTKQGEQPGPITQPTADFKTGIQGTKAETTEARPVTGNDVVEAIDKADTKRANEAERRDAEAKAREQKAKADAAGPRDYVTGEDVVKSLREKGHKI